MELVEIVHPMTRNSPILAMFFPLLLCAIIPISLALDPTRLVYEFPNNTWVENLAVRPNGSLLLTIITSPDLYLINPLDLDPKPQLIHHFSSSTWLTGITETDPNTYYVIGANATFQTLSPTPGSNFVYRVHFPLHFSPPEISVAAAVKNAIFLNGLITLNPTTLLASDSTLGAVWAIDITTGVSRIVIQDPLMAPTPALPQLGINGIRLFSNHTLYFANSAQTLLGTIPINLDGTAAGPAKKIASALKGTFFDDFALNRYGDAFLSTAAGDTIAEVRRDGTIEIIAGVVNTTGIAQPKSAQFGRTKDDRDVLYVTTSGGLALPIDGNVVVGGQVVAVDTGGSVRSGRRMVRSAN